MNIRPIRIYCGTLDVTKYLSPELARSNEGLKA